MTTELAITVDTADTTGHALAEAACENCATPLQGHYCHACGQTAHNPLRNFCHAVEEVFESFWHLDGRIFRTLRQLAFPGRVAREYLVGHRVRYIAPLRLFVVLSLLTFFVGKLVVHVDSNVDMYGANSAFDGATTVEEVKQERDKRLAEIDKDEAEARDVPGVRPTLIAARVGVNSAAANRIAELRAKDKTAVAAATPADTPANAAAIETAAPDTAITQPAARADKSPDACDRLTATPETRPWLPDFADNWINARIARACDNLSGEHLDANRILQSVLAAVPTALFLLMPVFALLLKIVYLGSGRSYLEHLVVALYSHAFLLLVLLAMFLLSVLGDAGLSAWVNRLCNITSTVLAAIWTPIYLFKTQRRVYGGGWLSNLVRYLVIGNVYIVLVTFAAVYAALAGISS